MPVHGSRADEPFGRQSPRSERPDAVPAGRPVSQGLHRRRRDRTSCEAPNPPATGAQPHARGAASEPVLQRLRGGEEVRGPSHAGAAADALDRARRRRRRRPPVRSRRAPGADTLATPASRSATLCAQPRRRTSTRTRSENVASDRTARITPGRLQAASTLAPEPAVIGSRAPTGTVSRSPDGGSAAGDADAQDAVAPVELHALAGDVAQAGQDRGGGVEQRVRPATRELGQRRPGPPAPVRGPHEHPVHLEPDGEPVRGRAGQPGPLAELGHQPVAGRPRPGTVGTALRQQRGGGPRRERGMPGGGVGRPTTSSARSPSAGSRSPRRSGRPRSGRTRRSWSAPRHGRAAPRRAPPGSR